MSRLDARGKTLPYMGEGDIPYDRIVEAVQDHEVLWGQYNGQPANGEYREIIRSTIDAMGRRMTWRGRFGFGRKSDPLEAVLDGRAKEFYRAFDDLRRGRIAIVAAGPRSEHPFLLFESETHFVAGAADATRNTLFYGHGLLETWRSDPRTHFLDGVGVHAFQLLLSSSLAYLLALHIGTGIMIAKDVQRIFDPEGRLQGNLTELVELTKKRAWPGMANIQMKAAVALRGYLAAWFDFMQKSSWLEIHHTLHDTKVVEKEESFLDTATTEISESARDVVLDQMMNSIFSAEEMERRDKQRREKQMEWTVFRIALGILYPREKALVRSFWEKERRRLSWKELEETYYEEIWDLMLAHLSGRELEQKIQEKDRATLGRWHFIFELKKSERPREKVRTLEEMTLDELVERKGRLLAMLSWEGKGLPPDVSWDDVIARFRKMIIRYHPDRTEITGIDNEEARRVSTDAINAFRELEIIHDLEPEIFGVEKPQAEG